MDVGHQGRESEANAEVPETGVLSNDQQRVFLHWLQK